MTEHHDAETTSPLIRWLPERIRSPRSRKVIVHMGILLATSLAWTVVWAVADVLVVIHAIPPPFNESRAYVTWYWLAAWDILFPIATLAVFRGHAWFPLMGLALGGWEDVFFYWVQGKHAPVVYYVTGPTTLGAALVLEVIVEVATHNPELNRRIPWSFLILVLVIALAWSFDGGRFTLLFPLVYAFTFLVTEAAKRLEVAWSWPSR